MRVVRRGVLGRGEGEGSGGRGVGEWGGGSEWVIIQTSEVLLWASSQTYRSTGQKLTQKPIENLMSQGILAPWTY